jgi:hypothetical protein
VAIFEGVQVNLCTALAGNGVTTNILERTPENWDVPALIRVSTVGGATPTCTYLIEGSADGVIWYPVPYSDSATPMTYTTATFVTTTTVVAIKYLMTCAWRYLRVTMSANTNVTNTIDAIAGE